MNLPSSVLADFIKEIKIVAASLALGDQLAQLGRRENEMALLAHATSQLVA